MGFYCICLGKGLQPAIITNKKCISIFWEMMFKFENKVIFSDLQTVKCRNNTTVCMQAILTSLQTEQVFSKIMSQC